MSDFNMSHGRMSDFVSFSLLGLTLSITLANLYFESKWNTLICFDHKNYARFDMSCQTVSDLV